MRYLSKYAGVQSFYGVYWNPVSKECIEIEDTHNPGGVFVNSFFRDGFSDEVIRNRRFIQNFIMVGLKRTLRKAHCSEYFNYSMYRVSYSLNPINRK